jgi:hypothetical protein
MANIAREPVDCDHLSTLLDAPAGGCAVDLSRFRPDHPEGADGQNGLYVVVFINKVVVISTYVAVIGDEVPSDELTRS